MADSAVAIWPSAGKEFHQSQLLWDVCPCRDSITDCKEVEARFLLEGKDTDIPFKILISLKSMHTSGHRYTWLLYRS
jgi:hypothetical protein